MSIGLKAVKMSETVYWVGAIDWDVRDIHGFHTDRGTTYNAYLILGKTVTLIDTVKRGFLGELMSRISSVIDPTKIDTIVSLHSEMDHSGLLPEVIAAVKPKKVYASVAGKEALGLHFHNLALDQITAVADNSTIDCGNGKMQFIFTSMLHWPDSMMGIYLDESIMFSQDLFGAHLATSELWADEVNPAVLESQGAAYFANILIPFAPIMQRLATKLAPTLAKVRVIAPDHGPVWRTKDIVERSLKWAEQAPANTAVILYDTMWGSVAQMARAIADGMSHAGTSVRVLRATSTPRSEVMTELLGAGCLLVGSPTLNKLPLPPIMDVLTYIQGLRPKNIIGGVFSSFGWSGGAVEVMTKMLTDSGIQVPIEAVDINYVPTAADLERCYAFGQNMSKALREHCANFAAKKSVSKL